MAKPFKSIKYTGILNLDDQFTFGSHQGKLVSEVVAYFPIYIRWLISNTDIKFEPKVNELTAAYRVPIKSTKYMPDYDHDTLSDWDDWFDDIPF